MPSRRIEEDHKHFRDVVSGKIRKALKKFAKNKFVTTKGKNGKMTLTIPSIDIPHIVYGQPGGGIGRGPGKKGDVIKRDQDDGNGPQAGQGEGEGIEIEIDMEEVLKFLQEELELPNLKPKPNEIVDETYCRYNSLSRQGPNSLRHPRRTLLEAMKRLAAMGDLEKTYKIPGFAEPMRVITPINSDFRYRQYTEINKPSSNAVIFFARDGSASMSQEKCDIISDMSWWIDVWVRRFYKRVERCYIWHDWVAQEVDENRFYKYRYGGGTQCSTAMQLIAKQLENRFPPKKWNIYVFYFSDGENWGDDSAIFCDVIKKYMSPKDVNMVGITQVLSYNYDTSLKKYVDNKLGEGFFDPEYLKTTAIGQKNESYWTGGWGSNSLSEDERNEGTKNAIVELLGAGGKIKKN